MRILGILIVVIWEEQYSRWVLHIHTLMLTIFSQKVIMDSVVATQLSPADQNSGIIFKTVHGDGRIWVKNQRSVIYTTS